MASQRSSTDLLANNASWDTGWFQLGLEDALVGVVAADRAITVHVLASGDGQHVDHVFDVAHTASTFDGSGNVTDAGTGGIVNVNPPLAYVRVVATNSSGSDLTHFRAFVRSVAAGARG